MMDTLWYALRNVFNIIKIKKNNQLPPYVIMIDHTSKTFLSRGLAFDTVLPFFSS